MGRDSEQFLGHVIHDVAGHRLGRALAVWPDEPAGAARWLLVGRGPWRRRLRAVPLAALRWDDGCGLRLPVTEAQVVDSPSLDGEQFDARAVRMLQQFWDEGPACS